MTVDDKIGDEKLQYDINREAAIISPLSSGKNEQAKCSYSPLGKPFEIQTKTIEEQRQNKQMLLKIKMKDQRL